MPSRATVEAFVAQVEAGRFLEAIEGYYAENATLSENGAPPRIGLEAILDGERKALERTGGIKGVRLSPILIEGNHVAIRWRYDFAPGGSLDEIAWQRWEGEKIAEEIFFYDPKQMGR